MTVGKVIFNMTMSLDGFVAGPNDGPENGMGDGGDTLFNLMSRPSCSERVFGCSII
jgi:hypothetical protein